MAASAARVEVVVWKSRSQRIFSCVFLKTVGPPASGGRVSKFERTYYGARKYRPFCPAWRDPAYEITVASGVSCAFFSSKRRIASRKCGQSTGLVRCSVKPAAELAIISSSGLNPQGLEQKRKLIRIERLLREKKRARFFADRRRGFSSGKLGVLSTRRRFYKGTPEREHGVSALSSKLMPAHFA